MNPKKRDREHDKHTVVSPPVQTHESTTNFRSVSACYRCRHRKNRCDQKVPRCTGCEKANVKCTSFDPISKREIPRSYVYYLETRVRSLEALLQGNNIPCPPPSKDFSISEAIDTGHQHNVPYPPQDEASRTRKVTPPTTMEEGVFDPALLSHQNDQEQLNKLASNIGMVSVQGTSAPGNAGPTAGIPFARVVYAAVKSSVAQTPSERAAAKPSKQLPSATASGGGGSDSFFGLNTKPAIKPAAFPERHIGLRLVELYFEYANPQIPILHRGEFMSLFERVYATDAKKRGPRELYMLNIVFAIGSGIIMGSADADRPTGGTEASADDPETPPHRKRQRIPTICSSLSPDVPAVSTSSVHSVSGSAERRSTIVGQQSQPEEYHSSAIAHLDSFMGSTPATDSANGGLEELQAVLLLAGLALLRPVAPGLWYIIGVAVRLAVDLGLHCEDVDSHLDGHTGYAQAKDATSKSLGRMQWKRDLRRRLWWCVYSFDRLVSTCVGRPFGITDQVVTTEFPSMQDDKYITTVGFLKPPNGVEVPSYKLIAYHYFRLRLLQSEILQVLQHRQTERVRTAGANSNNAYIHTDMPSPFLQHFKSFRDWRADVDRRLWDWKKSAPQQADTGVAFTPLFLELNYWQAVILLYRQSLSVPEPLVGEASPSTGDEVHSPGTANLEAKEDEEMVFMKVAQAGQTVLKIYRQLHRLKLVNFTFLATHHLFMSGISFLYAIWHSTLVRSQLTLDDVDFTILIATSVLTDLTDKCPPADACKDAFMRMSKATISMVMSTTGFGNLSTLGTQPLNSPEVYFNNQLSPEQYETQHSARRRMPMPEFDMKLKDLFSDEEIANRPFVPQQIPMTLVPQDIESSPIYNSLPMQPMLKQERSSYSDQSSQHTSPEQFLGQSFQASNQQPYQPFAETMAQAQPDFSMDNLDFLNTVPATDSYNTWGNPNDFDLGLGTGGTGYDGNGSWEANGGVDLFDGFFFGGNGGMAY